MNEKIFEYKSISDSEMLNYLSNQTGETIKDPMIRGWRFWAQFLGFGVINDMAFLPNAYVYVKDVVVQLFFLIRQFDLIVLIFDQLQFFRCP